MDPINNDMFRSSPLDFALDFSPAPHFYSHTHSVLPLNRPQITQVNVLIGCNTRTRFISSNPFKRRAIKNGGELEPIFIQLTKHSLPLFSASRDITSNPASCQGDTPVVKRSKPNQENNFLKLCYLKKKNRISF